MGILEKDVAIHFYCCRMERILRETFIFGSSHATSWDRVATENVHYHGKYRLTNQEKRRLGLEAEKRFKSLFPGLGGVSAWPGIFFMQEHDRYSFLPKDTVSQKNQNKINKFEEKVCRPNCKNCLCIFGTNDFMPLLCKDGKFPKITSRASNYFKSFPEKNKIDLNLSRNRNLLPGDAGDYIKSKVHSFMGYFVDVFGRSSVEVVFFSSLLERVYPGIKNLDLLFSVINSYLKQELNRFNEAGIVNKNGLHIKFVFINVSDQFYGSKNPLDLAREDEKQANKLVHRNIPCMELLGKRYFSEILENLA